MRDRIARNVSIAALAIGLTGMGLEYILTHHGMSESSDKTTVLSQISSDSAGGDIFISTPMRQRDFSVLSERWRLALSADFAGHGATLRPKGCSEYSRDTKNGVFPAQCYEVLYRNKDGVHAIMPVTMPMISLTNAHYTDQTRSMVSATVVYAQCKPNVGCTVQEPVTLTMKPAFYETLRALFVKAST